MTPDGFGDWPGAEAVARIGGPVRPIATDDRERLERAGERTEPPRDF